jgi:hypothetical protein
VIGGGQSIYGEGHVGMVVMSWSKVHGPWSMPMRLAGRK